jgi:hypothetical protein
VYVRLSSLTYVPYSKGQTENASGRKA